MLQALIGFPSQSFSYAEVQLAIENDTFDLDNFLRQVTPEQLLTAEIDGPYKGRTLLWLFARLAHQHPDYFLAVWHKFHQNITLTHILMPAEEGSHQGKSILWLLVAAVGLGQKESFDVVWERFNRELFLRDLLTKARTSDVEGVSILWLIADIANNTSVELFLSIWQRFNQDFTLVDLLDAPQVGPDRGLNLLWFLTNFAFRGYPELFQTIWERFNELLVLENFRVKPQEGPDKDRTSLWLLALAALRRRPKTFFAVWEKFKDQLTFDDLGMSVVLPNNASVSLCKLISSLEGGVRILLEAINQIPGIPSDRVREELSNISSAFSVYADCLFTKKRELYSLLERLQRHKTLGLAFKEHDLETLFSLGDAAYSAGYVNAFYEIHQLLENTTSTEAQSRALSKISAMSWYNRIATDFRAKLYFETALHIENNVAVRDLYLQTALTFAIKMQGKERSDLIQAIAYCYVTQRNDFDPALPYLSPLLLNLNDNEPDLSHILSILMVLREQADFRHREPHQGAAEAARTAAYETATLTSSSDEPTAALTATFSHLSFSATSAAAASPATVTTSSAAAVRPRRPKRH